MLWEKESNKRNALYIDILARGSNLKRIHDSNVRMAENTKPIPRKSDAIAEEKRKQGNVAFGTGAWAPAMELYNESLCFAQDSSLIGLAYANRSACFLNLTMYDQCMKDIKMARENDCPDHVITKLDQRMEKCLKQLREGATPAVFGADLSFDRHEKFPSMVNVLDVQKDNFGKFSVIANDDIDVDKTIINDELFLRHLTRRYGSKCGICLIGYYTNLMPCTKCAVAMFCEGCQHHYLHEYECGLNVCGPGGFNNDILFEVRATLLAVYAFPSIDALMEFVDGKVQSGSKELADSLTDDQSKYSNIFTAASQKVDNPIVESAWWIYSVYNTILSIPQINEKFQSKKHLRFLQHLIGLHSAINTSHVVFSAQGQGRECRELSYVVLMENYFKHSCAPNVISISHGGHTAYITARPIKRGEELLVAKYPFVIDPTTHRQKYMSERGVQKCECERCKGISATPTQRQQMTKHPSYEYMIRNKCMDMIMGIPDLQSTIEPIAQCVKFLQEYGRSNWCDELKLILTVYQALLYVRVAGPIHGHFIDDRTLTIITPDSPLTEAELNEMMKSNRW